MAIFTGRNSWETHELCGTEPQVGRYYTSFSVVPVFSSVDVRVETPISGGCRVEREQGVLVGPAGGLL